MFVVVGNRKPKNRNSVVFLVGFREPKPSFFGGRFFSCLKKRKNQEKRLFFFGRFCFLQPTAAAKKRPKPIDISLKERKTDRGHFHFRFTTNPHSKQQKRPKPTDTLGENRKTDRAIFICGLFAIHHNQPWSPHGTKYNVHAD